MRFCVSRNKDALASADGNDHGEDSIPVGFDNASEVCVVPGNDVRGGSSSEPGKPGARTKFCLAFSRWPFSRHFRWVARAAVEGVRAVQEQVRSTGGVREVPPNSLCRTARSSLECESVAGERVPLCARNQRRVRRRVAAGKPGSRRSPRTCVIGLPCSKPR
jgi:hypothetical protein